MKTKLYAKTKIYEVSYLCPHCKQDTHYQTDGIPKGECHKCLKKIEFIPEYLNTYE
ncbi:MAG: hypothetical protein U9O94_04390 [Nanoarchaeota archaeon]|nr:hypothetical protein [Nanoarchaeota archaeon]